jgi:hypothetical protein
MSAANDSFLKLIGMSDSSAIHSKAKASSSSVAAVAAPVTDEPSTTLEQSHPLSDVPAHSDEVFAHSPDSPGFLSEEPTATQEITENDFGDEATIQAESGGFRQTNIYGDQEEAVLIQELQQDATLEDKLLAGVEEADASRATDIFAQSYRADSRKTRLHGQAESFVEFEDQSTAKSKTSIAESHSSRTIILSDAIEGLSESQILSQDLSAAPFADEGIDQAEAFTKKIPESELAAEAALEGLADEASGGAEDPIDELYESYKEAVVPAGSGISRKTVAFEYPISKAQRADEPIYRLIPLAHSPIEGEIELTRLPYSIGRDPKNDLSVDDSNASRFHAEFREVQGQIVVVDLQSTNGVQVNDKTQPEAVLKNFDIIQIGNLKLRFEVEGDLESGAAAASDSDAALDGSEPPNSNQETMMIPTNNRKLKRSGSKRMRWLALATIVLAGSFWAFQNTARIQEFLQSSLKGFVQGQLSALPAQIAQDLGKPISEAAPEDVKSLVLQKMQSFPLPEDMKQYLQQVPAELYHSILSDPELTQALIDNNGNIAEVFALMRSRMIEAFKAQRNEEASKYVDLFLKEAPENAELLTMRKELDERMSFVGLEKGQLVTPEERETFVKIMMQHNKTYEEYVSAQDFDGAKDYATKLLERLDNLVKQKPQFAEYVTSAGTEWRGKQRQMNQSIEERSKRRALIAKQEEKGADLIAEINQLFLAKRYSDSLRKTNDFIRAYPDHGDIASMEGLRDDLIREIKVTLDRTRQDITSLVQIENFKQAWDLLYQIGDQVGVDHQSFLEIRAELESKTSAKGAQLYNQARVFEFEADDIVAAEQFYKKTLDTVDPRGELADKANRRFQAVRRKNLQ